MAWTASREKLELITRCGGLVAMLQAFFLEILETLAKLYPHKDNVLQSHHD